MKNKAALLFFLCTTLAKLSGSYLVVPSDPGYCDREWVPDLVTDKFAAQPPKKRNLYATLIKVVDGLPCYALHMFDADYNECHLIEGGSWDSMSLEFPAQARRFLWQKLNNKPTGIPYYLSEDTRQRVEQAPEFFDSIDDLYDNIQPFYSRSYFKKTIILIACIAGAYGIYQYFFSKPKVDSDSNRDSGENSSIKKSNALHQSKPT